MFWEGEGRWFRGTIDAYDPHDNNYPFHISYDDDSDEEDGMLTGSHWETLEGRTKYRLLPAESGTGSPAAVTAPEQQQTLMPPAQNGAHVQQQPSPASTAAAAAAAVKQHDAAPAEHPPAAQEAVHADGGAPAQLQQKEERGAAGAPTDAPKKRGRPPSQKTLELRAWKEAHGGAKVPADVRREIERKHGEAAPPRKRTKKAAVADKRAAAGDTFSDDEEGSASPAVQRAQPAAEVKPGAAGCRDPRKAGRQEPAEEQDPWDPGTPSSQHGRGAKPHGKQSPRTTPQLAHAPAAAAHRTLPGRPAATHVDARLAAVPVGAKRGAPVPASRPAAVRRPPATLATLIAAGPSAATSRVPTAPAPSSLRPAEQPQQPLQKALSAGRAADDEDEAEEAQEDDSEAARKLREEEAKQAAIAQQVPACPGRTVHAHTCTANNSG